MTLYNKYVVTQIGSYIIYKVTLSNDDLFKLKKLILLGQWINLMLTLSSNMHKLEGHQRLTNLWCHFSKQPFSSIESCMENKQSLRLKQISYQLLTPLLIQTYFIRHYTLKWYIHVQMYHTIFHIQIIKSW